MTEIRLDVELAHPPERVWRALTDARIVTEWFMPTGLRPVPGYRFRLDPAGQVGFEEPIDGEVLEVEPGRRLTMRWQAPELDARVTLTITRVGRGCRLTLRQSGFFGMQGLLRRRVLHRAYTEMLGRRLPEVLDRLAAKEGRGGPVGAALARRRSQRVRAGDGSGRRNVARRFQRRGAVIRRIRAVGKVRVSRPLNLESTVAFPVAYPGGARRRPAHGRGRSAHGRGRPAHGRSRAAHGRPARQAEWLRALSGRLYRAREDAAPVAATVRRVLSTLLRHPDGRRDRAVFAAAGLLLAIGVVSLIVVAGTILYPAKPPQVATGPESEPGYAQLPGRPQPSGSPAVSRSASPPPGGTAANAPSSPAAAGAELTASYRTESVRLGGYRGAVTITNPGQQPVTGWTVVITLPPLNLTVRDTAGAEYQQNGLIVTFAPKADTRLVRPGASVLFSFEVDGVGPPTGCAVDGRPCAGLSE